MKRARRPVEYFFPVVILVMSGAALAGTSDPVNLPSLAVSVFGLAAVLCFWKLRIMYPVFVQIWLYAQLFLLREVHTLPTGENSSISMERVYFDATQFFRLEMNIGLRGDADGGALQLGVNLLAILGSWLFLRHLASVIGCPVAVSALQSGTEPADTRALRGSVLGEIRFEGKTWLLLQLEQALTLNSQTIQQLLIRPKDSPPSRTFRNGRKKESADIRTIKDSLSGRTICGAEDLHPQPATGMVAVGGLYG